MTYPRIFYYPKKQKSNKSDYQRESTGSSGLNPIRMLRNHPAWKKRQGHRNVDKQKILLLSDWDDFYDNGHNYWEFKRVLNQLLKDGFTIYFKKEDQFLLLNEKKLAYDYDPVYINPNQLVTTFLEKNPSISKEQLHVLDHYWIDIISKSIIDNFPRRRIAINIALRRGATARIFHSMYPHLKIMTPPVDFIYSEFGIKATPVLRENLYRPTLPIIQYEYEVVVLTEKQICVLLNEERFELYGLTISFHQLKLVKNITVKLDDGDYLEPPFIKLFHHMPALENVTITGNLNKYQPSERWAQSVPQLKVLDLDNAQLNFSHVISFLTPSFKLEQLTIPAEVIANTFKMDHTINVKSLHIVNSSYSPLSISAKLLEQFLLKCNGIRYFRVQNLIINGNMVKPLDQPLLEVLDMSHSEFSVRTFAFFICKSEKLKILSLYYAHLIDEFVIDLDCPSLESMSVDGLKTSTFNLECLLNNVNKVTSLNLEQIDTKLNISRSLNLHSLKTLRLPYIESDFVLHRCLQRVPQLKSLNMIAFPDCLLVDFNLPKLKSFECGNRSEDGKRVITSNHLKRLLSTSNKLINLKIIKFGGTLLDISFPNLEELFIGAFANNHVVSPQELIHLIKSLPKLRKIYLPSIEISLNNLQLKSLLDQRKIKVNKSYCDDLGDECSSVMLSLPRLSDPVHNPQQHLMENPDEKDFKFEYKNNEDQYKHQDKIINQLIQYLKIQHKGQEHWAKINKGICAVLSSLFNAMTLDEWNQFSHLICGWNGEQKTFKK